MSAPDPDQDTVMEMEAESRRDHFFPIADEDVTFADPDGGTGLDSWDWPPPPGRRPPLSFGEEQANIINATGA